MFFRLVRLVGVLLLVYPSLVAEDDPAELFQAGRFQEAAEELKRRVTKLETLPQLGLDDQHELANTLLALGMSRQALGETEAAISVLEQAAETLLSLEAKPNEKAQVFDALARARQQAGQLSEAEANFRESLAWRERDQSANASYWLGVTTDHLGLLLLTSGNYQEAGEILQKSLAATSAEQPRLLAQRHHYVARYLHSIRNYHRASEHARKSLEIGRTLEGVDLASYLDLLALSLYRSGDQAGAEAALLEALALLREQPINLQRARGEAEILNKVGEFALGEEANLARSSFQEALDGLLEWLPAEHPSLAVYHNNLGLAAMQMKDHELAEHQFSRALAILEGQIEGLKHGHQRRAEWKQNLAWNAFLAGDAEQTKETVTAACQEAEAVLQHLLEKGSEHERLNFLAHFDLFSLPACANEPEILHGLLSRNKGLLLDTLISSKKLPATTRAETKRLPPHSAFIDFVRYRKPTTKGWTFAYGATLELPDGTIDFVPLDDEKVLLRWLNVLSERLSYRTLALAGQEVEPPVIRLEAALRQLQQRFLQPLLTRLPEDTETLALSPDGSLHFAPFACFLDEERKFFAQSYSHVVNVSSRRDLFQERSPNTLADGFWYLFGMSKFDDMRAEAHKPWFLENLANLPHVKEELQELSQLAPPASHRILNPTRPEETLKNLPEGASVLHLATHAFFRDTEEERFLTDLDAQPELLLRSGLALSKPDGSNDGILYPHEIAQLPLSQTQLVSLSACHTGLGTPLAGEGVLGLRRAFAMAGAKSLLLALWQVPDHSTADFMASFYQEAMATENPSYALWQLQARLLHRDAGFVKDDAALEEAVLRHGPFLITHRGPIPEIPQGNTEQIIKPRIFWWHYLLWLVVFGSLIALLLRFSTKRKQAFSDKES